MASLITVTNWRLDRSPDGAATLWFDQPGRSDNALNGAALGELDAVLTEVESDPEIRALAIRSAKPAGFCAGVDLETILVLHTPEDAETLVLPGSAVLDHLAGLSTPSVAVIHGVCLGAGLELALACRRRVAVASSVPLQIGMPEVEHGLIPFWGGISRLPHLIGPDDGLDLLISGRSIGFLLARSLGIVDRLAAEADPLNPLELAQSARAAERTWSRDDWEAAWNRAHAQVASAPGEFPEAQLHVLNIISIGLAHGPEAAREATQSALAELVFSEGVREAVQALLQRGSSGRH